MKIVIPGRLPGLNEMIDAAKKGKGKYQPYAQMKETYTDMVAWLAKKLPQKYGPIRLVITWYEPDRKRDPDNIAAAEKFILDGLVKAGTILNDTQKYIKSIHHEFENSKDNARIEVELTTVNQ
jgi:Holliday junction resolvase RusA-like endonuclease